MTAIHVEVKDQPVKALLNRLQARVKNMRPALNAVGADLIALVDEGFEKQRDPYGRAWTPLRPATIRARRKGKGIGNPEILQDVGHLRSSFHNNVQVTDIYVQIGSNEPYAAIHQFGGVIKRRLAAGSVRLRTNARGELLTRGNLATFATRIGSKAHKRYVTRAYVARDYQIHIPARPMLPFNGLPDHYHNVIVRRLNAYLSAS